MGGVIDAVGIVLREACACYVPLGVGKGIDVGESARVADEEIWAGGVHFTGFDLGGVCEEEEEGEEEGG